MTISSSITETNLNVFTFSFSNWIYQQSLNFKLLECLKSNDHNI